MLRCKINARLIAFAIKSSSASEGSSFACGLRLLKNVVSTKRANMTALDDTPRLTTNLWIDRKCNFCRAKRAKIPAKVDSQFLCEQVGCLCAQIRWLMFVLAVHVSHNS